MPFYIGKGTGKRAWSGDRHLLWHSYVTHHLGGVYTVQILVELEGDWIAQEGATLVNWVNSHRNLDYAAHDRFHALCNAVRERVQTARGLDASDLAGACTLYRDAIAAMQEYLAIMLETGRVAQLIEEQLN